MKRFWILGVMVASLCAWFGLMPAEAHHSFAAQYDRSKPVQLEGTVTNIQWANPHIYFYIDVADANGAVTNWAIELGAPNGLRRRGWSKDTLKAGDHVQIEGWLAKNGDPTANASTVIGPNGARLFAGTSNEEYSNQ